MRGRGGGGGGRWTWGLLRCFLEADTPRVRCARHGVLTAAVGTAQGPRRLSPGQREALAQIAADSKQLYKAYLMKEQLREVFKVKGEHGKTLLTGLIAWCQRCRIPEFTALAKTPETIPAADLEQP